MSHSRKSLLDKPMKLLLVTYWLKKPDRDYSCLWNLLRSAPGWWHYLEWAYIIETDETENSWVDKIRNAIDSMDCFLVVEITDRTIKGWLPEDAWAWINEKTKQKPAGQNPGT